MPTVPAVPTFSPGVLTTSQMNQLCDAINFLHSPPIAKLRQTVAQTLTTGVNTAITFTTESVDSDVDGVGGHDNASNTSRYTARYAGWYGVAGGVSFIGNATGIRLVRFAVNGTADDASDSLLINAGAGNTQRQPSRTTMVYLNEGDYVELYATQTSGGNLNTVATAGGEQSHMTVWRISR